MLIHSVYFWANEGSSAEDLADFRRGLESLKTIDSVRQAYIGVPADTDRPVIERSYTYGLILVFDDQHGHDLYQYHEIHDRFRQQCSRYWSKLLIFDCVA